LKKRGFLKFFSLLQFMMEAGAPIPPVTINATAPDRAPPRRIRTKKKFRKINRICPAVPAQEAPKRVALVDLYLNGFLQIDAGIKKLFPDIPGPITGNFFPAVYRIYFTGSTARSFRVIFPDEVADLL
jgi:hypothetical protein